MAQAEFVQHGPQDYLCPACGHIEFDVRADWVPVPESERLYKGQERKLPYYCLACYNDGRTAKQVMDWLPSRAANDLLTGGTGLAIQIGDEVKVFSSAHEMRSFAAESQRRARNGEGVPISFRVLEQNRGNMDRNTLSNSEFEKNRQIPHADILAARTGLNRDRRGQAIERRRLTETEARRYT